MVFIDIQTYTILYIYSIVNFKLVYMFKLVFYRKAQFDIFEWEYIVDPPHLILKEGKNSMMDSPGTNIYQSTARKQR